MILKFCLLTLLVVTNAGAQRIKGGPRILQAPPVVQDISPPHVHVGKGVVGGGGPALHHTAVVTDPVSLNPVVVEKVTTLGAGGLGVGGLGANSAQFTLADSQISSFGPRRLYRAGASQVPFGLSGLDYYSYPASLLSRRNLGRKTIVSDNLSGLSPIGLSRPSAIIADPTTSQFSVGDVQIRSNLFGGRGLYRTGVSRVPFGLSGLDYFSYPRSLLTQRRILGDGLGQTKILTGGGFTAGDAQVRGIVAEPLGQERVTIVESAPAVAGPAIVQAAVPEQVTTVIGDGGFGQRQVTVTRGGIGALRGGNIILGGGQALGGFRRLKTRPVIQTAAPVQEVLVDATSGLGAPFGGFGQRTAVAKTVAPSPIIAAAPAPIVQAPVFAPAPIVAAPAPVIAAPVGRRLGEAFLTQVARPVVAARRIATLARPVAPIVSQPRVAVVHDGPRFAGPGNIHFTLGNTQIIGGPIAAPAPIVAPRPFVAARPVVAVQRPTFGIQRPVVAVQQPAPVVAVQRPVVALQQPQVVSQVKTAGFGARRVLARQIPQMVYVDGGSRFPGIDIIGGYRIGDPRHNYAQLPISTSRFANLGLSQASIDAGPVLLSPAPAPLLGTKSAPVLTSGGIVAPVAKTAISSAAPLGLAAVGHTSPTKIVTQEEVIGPAGDSQIVTTVREAAGPSKIGGPVVAGPLGLSAVGQTAPAVVTQEEVIGPAGDSQIVTTVTKAAPSKIGGPVVSAPLGLAAVGHTSPAKVVTQEEVIGPAGDRQVITTVTDAGPSKIGGPVIAGPAGLSGIGQIGGTKTVTQEEVIGPAGDSQIVTTVTNAGPSKIGGPVVAAPLGLSAVGHTSPAKVVTQEEVIGPAGDSQIVTTVREAAVPSKIGGSVVSSPLGFSAVGQAPTKVITQEEVVGPAGDSQIVTTVSETSPANIVQQEEVVGLSPGISALTASPLAQEISQGPIGVTLAQDGLGGSAIVSSGPSLLSPVSQSIVDPIGAGQTQISVDDVIGSGPAVTTIREVPTLLSDGSVGSTLTKVTEVSQQHIDPVVQQSISSGFDGGLGGYVPRVSFLSQFPYDVPDRALLRQALTRPIVQEQQQLEQILV